MIGTALSVGVVGSELLPIRGSSTVAESSFPFPLSFSFSFSLSFSLTVAAVRMLVDARMDPVAVTGVAVGCEGVRSILRILCRESA